MQLLNQEKQKQVSGGNPVILAGVEAVGLFIAVPEIGSAIGQDWTYPTIGAGVGEAVYNYNNPNPLGQMEFTINDFPHLQ